MQRENTDPGEQHEKDEDAAEAERRQADEAREHRVRQDHDELGHHQDDAVLGMPLHLGVVLLDQERDERQRPQIGEHDHHAAIR